MEFIARWRQKRIKREFWIPCSALELCGMLPKSWEENKVS